ncbi:MAG: hypothetical protein KDE35_15055 [Geminicoccaceae bacterium]|nr:hypothetical protein [Geminicoccaceae bacterium]
MAYRMHEFAAATGLSRSFLYMEVKAGKLKVTKIGRATLVLRDDGVRYLEKYRNAQVEEEEV